MYTPFDLKITDVHVYIDDVTAELLYAKNPINKELVKYILSLK